MGKKRCREDNSFIHHGTQKQACQQQPKQVKRLQPEKRHSSPPRKLNDLKPEFLCSILGFLGPTSQSLISLAMVNKKFSDSMRAIGKTMLPRAKSHFRIPLKPKSAIESPTSLFVRHTRICSKILFDLTELRFVFNIDPSEIPKLKIQEALTTVFELLEISPALSIALERQVLSTCGKCGGKLFKFCKHMLKNNNSLREESNNLNAHLSKEFCESLLDFSQKVMKSVVYREMQISKQARNGTTKYIETRDGLRCIASACPLNRIR